MVFTDLWSTTLKHRTETVQEQLDLGLYAIKRYAFYLQKIVEIRRPSSNELKKVTDYEAKEKSSKATKDAMSDFVVSYTVTQSCMAQTFDYEIAFINALEKDVVNFILTWHTGAEKKLAATNKKLVATFAKQKDLLMKITKSRSECHKQWSTLQSAWKESEKSEQTKLTKKNGMKEYEVAFKKYSQTVGKTAQVFNAFEAEVREGNEQQRIYWEEELPQCLKEFEMLETERLQTWGIAMENYRNAQNEFYTRSFEATKALDEVTESLDGSKGMKAWTESLVKAYGYPKEPDTILEYLPCEYTRVQQGDDLQHLLSIDLSVALQQRQQSQASATGANNNARGTLQGSASFMGALGANNNNMSNSVPDFVKPSYAHGVGRALWDYSGDADDLPMQKGEFLALLDMPLPQPGDATWWIAAKFDYATGRLLQKGIIPSNYITFDF